MRGSKAGSGAKRRRIRNVHAKLQGYARSLVDILNPQPALRFYDWVKKNRRMSSESSALSTYSFAKTPYMKGIMEALDDPEVREVTLMSGAQIGKSELGNNFVLYMISEEPGPILFLLPTLTLAQAYSRQRITPMIRDNPSVRHKFASFGKKRTLGDSVLEKSFSGGSLTLVGSNSPAQLCSRPIKVTIVDEIDRMVATVEGDPVALAVKRTVTYENKRKVLYLSTPSRAFVSRIDHLYKQGSMSKFYVPCHLCGYEQILIFKQIKFEHINNVLVSGTAKYQCEKCQGYWNDQEKQKNCQKGHWVATANGYPRSKRSFWVNEYYSGFRKMDSIAQDFLDAKDREDMLQVFINTSEGLPYESGAAKMDYNYLYNNRREFYDDGTFENAEILMLTAGVDVQKDRLVYEVVAWGKRYESWGLLYRHILGDTSKQDVWDELEEAMAEVFSLGDAEYQISKVAIDTNYQGHMVKKLIKRTQDKRYMPIKGRANQEAYVKVPSLNDTRKDKVYKGGFRVYYLGVDKLKEELYAYLGQESLDVELESLGAGQEGRSVSKSRPVGLCHFPMDYNLDYFKEITSEVQVMREIQGVKKYQWEILGDRRNEALDCRIYARAAAYHEGYDRKTMAVTSTRKGKSRGESDMWSSKDVRL
jgi:phage terminase large subunit GpA-like protein